jgi:hypothetical protein
LDVGGGRTRFELEHIAPGDDEHWPQFGPGAVGVGWELALPGLGRHLASGTAVNPADAAAWTLSEEGRQFISLSSQGWGEAAIEAGEEAVGAREAAVRTTAFYTGA